MFEWVRHNIETVIVGAALALLIAFIIARMVKNKKQGKAACGCGCSDCAMKASCKSNKEKK